MKALLFVAAAVGGVAGNQVKYGDCADLQGHRLQYLTRVSVSCPSTTGLRGWQLVKDTCGNDRYRMRYTCSDSGTVASTCTTRDSGCEIAEGKRLHYFDRHEMYCNTPEVMKSWRMLSRNSDGCGSSRRKTQWECCQHLGSGSQEVFYTDCSRAKDSNVQWLREYKVDCGETGYLEDFEMLNGDSDSCGGDNRQFKFRCRREVLDVTQMSNPEAIRTANGCQNGNTFGECSKLYLVQSVTTQRYLTAAGPDLAVEWMPTPSAEGCSDWYLAHAADYGASSGFTNEFYMLTHCSGVTQFLVVGVDGTVTTSKTKLGSPQLTGKGSQRFSLHETYYSLTWSPHLGGTGYEYYLRHVGNEKSGTQRWGPGGDEGLFYIFKKN